MKLARIVETEWFLLIHLKSIGSEVESTGWVDKGSWSQAQKSELISQGPV
jgi:hypothetical protein